MSSDSRVKKGLFETVEDELKLRNYIRSFQPQANCRLASVMGLSGTDRRCRVPRFMEVSSSWKPQLVRGLVHINLMSEKSGMSPIIELSLSLVPGPLSGR